MTEKEMQLIIAKHIGIKNICIPINILHHQEKVFH